MACSKRYKKDLEEALLVLACDSSDSSDSSGDEECILIELASLPRRRLGKRLHLEDLSNLECEEMFRFAKEEMFRLASALELPDTYICSQGTKATGMEALMVMLRRFTYPNRFCDLVPIFGRDVPELSLIFNRIIDDVYDRFGFLLRDFNLVWLDPEVFSRAVHNKGAPLQQCFAFIDGTVRPIARPIINQRIMYSGHKRVHCVKFQSVTTPNGLIAHMFGPIEGRRHDAFMLSVSGLPRKLQPLTTPAGGPYVLYGDPAYGLSQNILSPFRGAQLSQQEQSFNRNMSAVRVSVEWSFGKIVQYFPYLDFKKNLKILLQPIGKYYLIGALLTNCHTCLNGSQTSTFFDVQPPSLEQYLSNI